MLWVGLFKKNSSHNPYVLQGEVVDTVVNIVDVVEGARVSSLIWITQYYPCIQWELFCAENTPRYGDRILLIQEWGRVLVDRDVDPEISW